MINTSRHGQIRTMIRQNSSDIKGAKPETFIKKSTAISDKNKNIICRLDKEISNALLEIITVTLQTNTFF